MAKHSSQPGFSLRHSRLLRLLLPLVTILVLLTGCDALSCNCPPAVTAHISAPNTRPITGLDRVLLNAANSYNPGLIFGLAPYAASDGTEHLLAVLDGDLYALPTASGPTALIRKSICPSGGIALSSDASRLGCLGSPITNLDTWRVYGCYHICFSEQLQTMTFVSTAQPQARLTQSISDGNHLFSSPSWRPDGEAIAALDFANPEDNVSNADSASCAIAVYGQASADSPTLVPALSLTIAEYSLCRAVQIAWSPDGKTLAVLDSQTLLLLDAPSPVAITTATQKGRFTKSILTPRLRVPLQQSMQTMAWAPDSHSVTVASRDSVTSQFQIAQYSLNPSKPPILLLNLEGIPIGPIAYSFDGRALFFAAGIREAYALPLRRPLATPGSAYHSGPFSARAFRPQVCDCPQPPAGLYAYTLPTS